MSEPQRYPTRDELDYLARKEAGFPGLGVPASQSKGEVTQLQTQFAVEDNDTSAYIGVTSDRMTYANETEQPLQAQGSTDDDAEVAREDRVLSQEYLVAPTPPTPDANQTAGGGSTQETLLTATSGESLSAEIANPTETEKVPVGETTAAPSEPGGDTAEVGVSGGSSGETVSDNQAEQTAVSPGASPAPDSLVGAGDASPEETPSGTAAAPEQESKPVPTPTKKASATKSNAT